MMEENTQEEDRVTAGNRSSGEPGDTAPLQNPLSGSDLSGNRKRRGIGSLLFFGCAVCSLLFTMVILLLSIVQNRGPLEYDWNSVSSGGRLVSGYLSHEARWGARVSAVTLLRSNRRDLEHLEHELVRAQKERESFYRDIEEMEKDFEENISVFDLDESMKNLKSIVFLLENRIEFRGQVLRRKRMYEDAYKERISALLERKEKLMARGVELTSFIKRTATDGSMELPLYRSDFFMDEVKFLYLSRLGAYIGNGAFVQAGEMLNPIPDFTFSDGERILLEALQKTVSDAALMEARIDAVEEGAFERIFTRTVAENYADALEDVKTLQDGGFTSPLLGQLRSALSLSIEDVLEIKKDIGINGEVKGLARRASGLEREGELEKALLIYEDILVFSIPPYDREYALRKFYSLKQGIERDRSEREQNTRAIKYLESARTLIHEEKDDDALKFYKLVITDCPQSSYVKHAIQEIIKTVRFESD